MSHSAKVPAQAIANRTMSGTGISLRRPDPAKIARAMSARAMPTKAQTIHEGKYEPKILREGAPSQPLNKHRIGPAALGPAMQKYRVSSPRQNRTGDLRRAEGDVGRLSTMTSGVRRREMASGHDHAAWCACPA